MPGDGIITDISLTQTHQDPVTHLRLYVGFRFHCHFVGAENDIVQTAAVDRLEQGIPFLVHMDPFAGAGSVCRVLFFREFGYAALLFQRFQRAAADLQFSLGGDNLAGGVENFQLQFDRGPAVGDITVSTLQTYGGDFTGSYDLDIV